MQILGAIVPLILAAISAPAIGEHQPGGSVQTAQQQATIPAGSQPVAQGLGGVLTVDAVNAYIEALEFCLLQVGQPTRFDAAGRTQIAQALAQFYPTAPIETQTNLAQARATWMQYAQNWNVLPMDDKREFAYEVLALYVGEQVAANALGFPQGGAGGQAGQAGPGSMDGYGAEPDYDGSGCWAAAGCTDYDASSDTYTYEEYDYSTDTYEPE